MLEHLQRLAALSQIDVQLDEMREELGDLPYDVEELEASLQKKQAEIDKQEEEVNAIHQFRAEGQVTMERNKEKIEKLTEQQFSVRNNREFDAVTKEIETLKLSQSQLQDDLVSSKIKVDNLSSVLEDLKSAFSELTEKSETKKQELAVLSDDQNEEMSMLVKQRAVLIKHLDKKVLRDYKRIFEYHKDVAVPIHKGSCAGCFSFMPPQLVVEMRKYENVKFCENCGRIMFPEEMEIPQDFLVST